ncbi:MAG: type II secretion system F family protein [Phycisphaerae bacterium]
MISPLGFFNVDTAGQALSTVAIFVLAVVMAGLAYAPAMELIQRRRTLFNRVLRQSLLIDITPRAATLTWLIGSAVMGILAGLAFGSVLAFLIVASIGLVLPGPILSILRRRRISKLEDQLVGGIHQLSAGVRAGLNLVQAMQLIARDGPRPLRQEFRHLLREYEYGVPLDQAMSDAATRIGSGDFRLLFSALQTHRQRGGDLGKTLDEIAAAIREIQRLEKRVETLTAQGRTTARWLGAMPLIVLGVLFVIEKSYVISLFDSGVGQFIIGLIIVLNLAGFLWIRKIIAIDI